MKVFETTHKYLVADLKFKEAAVYKFHEPNEKGKEYQMRNSLKSRMRFMTNYSKMKSFGRYNENQRNSYPSLSWLK